MTKALACEIRKLSGSLALLLALAAPLLPPILVVLALVTNERALQWGEILGQVVMPLWAMFMFPMLAAAFCTLVAQIEHRTRGWDFMLAQPISRWEVFTAKSVVVVCAMALSTAWLLGATVTAGLAVGFFFNKPPSGELNLEVVARIGGSIFLASLWLLAIQLWAALRWRNFVASLTVGIAGTLVGMAVMITGATKADWFPWVIPIRVLGDVESAAPIGLAIAASGATFVAMLLDLARRDFR